MDNKRVKYPFGSTKAKVGPLEKLSYANLDFLDSYWQRWLIVI